MSAHTIHIKEAARPGFFALSGRIRPSFGFRYLRQRPRLRFPRFVILRGDFGRAMGVIFFLHFALYLTNPLYYPYWVDELRYADQLISVGTALFYIFQFAGSTRLAAISRRLGERRALAVGAFLLAAYPGLTALSGHPAAFFSASILGGTGWGIAGGAVLAYLLALVPVNQRPQYMAWNSLLVNLAILTGALTAPFLSEWAGLRGGIGIAALVRLGSVLVILTLGKISQERGERRGAKRE